MYADSYGWEKEAMRLYARLEPGRRAAQCAGCAAPCEAACDFGLPVRALLSRADHGLRWA
jgi:hypothetical protein